jgi:hypothetical protein
MSMQPSPSTAVRGPRPITPASAFVRRAAALVIVHGILIAGAVFILLPFVWMMITSIKSPAEIFAVDFSLWPKKFSGAENYGYALTKAPLLRFALNGVIVCAGILVVQVLVAVPCAYALAKLRFPGRTALMALVLMGLCIPIQVPALPLYMGLARLGLLNTYFAIMMPFFLSVFAIFLFRQFFKGYPDEIIMRRARRNERVRDRLAHRRAQRLAGDRRIRRLLVRRALERPLLAADRHLGYAARHAAARYDVLCRCRDRVELRRR